MTNSYRRIFVALVLAFGSMLTLLHPSTAQEAGSAADGGAALVIDEPEDVEQEGVDTAGIVGEDIQVTWGDDGVPIVRVAIPATVFMPIEEEEKEDMYFTLQEELNRLGCDAGPVDGDWGRNSERAMDRLRDAVPDIAEMELSITLAGLLQKMPEGTCPLVCSVREVKVENRCELKTCPSGQYLDTRGTCRVRQAKASKPKASGGGGGGGRNCATYNGRTYCN